MGVGGLWSLLSPVGKEISLEFCKGKKLAVDLSAWIVQCSVVATARPIPASYLCVRGIFMRTLNLLSLGVSLVFVIDGPNPPTVKRKTKNRDDFYRTALEYKVLLTALGLPVIVCDGEAEKLCAELNHRKLVDGVITNDGDALIYGAETIYKGLLQDKKEHFAMVYHMEDVNTSLSLTRRDLVAFALLSAGDFSPGVPNIREKKFTELMKEFKLNKIEDALDRFMSWSSNTDLDCLDNKMKSLADMKTRHCTRCLHEGTKQEHKNSGCQVCQVDSECRQGDAPDHPPCLCEYHLAEETVKTYKVELKLRELALKSYPDFPDRAVIQEYLDPLPQMLDDVDLSVRMPDFQAVCSIIQQHLHYSFQKTMSYLVPATIKMAFHGVLPDLDITPLCIIKKCKVNFEQCFMVRWKRLDQDELSDESSYAFQLSQNLFASKYPDMVEEFMGATRYPVKRKHSNSSQSKLTSHFKTVKQAIPSAKSAEWSYRRAVSNTHQTHQTCKPPDPHTEEIEQHWKHQPGHTEHQFHLVKEKIDLEHRYNQAFEQAEYHCRQPVVQLERIDSYTGQTEHQFHLVKEKLDLEHRYNQAFEQAEYYCRQPVVQLERIDSYTGQTEHQFHLVKEKLDLEHRYNQAFEQAEYYCRQPVVQLERIDSYTGQTDNPIGQPGNLIEQIGNLIGQSGNLIGQPDNLIEQTGNLIGQIDNLIRQTDNEIGQTDNVIGQRDNLIRQTDNLIGQTSNMIGQTQDLVGQPYNLIRQTDNLLGQTDNVIGQTDNMVGQTQDLIGRTDNMVGQTQDLIGQTELQPGQTSHYFDLPDHQFAQTPLNRQQCLTMHSRIFKFKNLSNM